MKRSIGRNRARAVQRLILSCALPLVGRAPLQAQEGRAVQVVLAAEGQTQELRLADGSVFVGQVVDAGDPATFRLLSGIEMKVPHAQISALAAAEGVVKDGAYLRPDPNRTRLFFGSTARALPQGAGYFQVFEVFLPFLTVGVTDDLAVSAGTPLVFGDTGDRPYWIAPKLRVWGDGRTDVALGAIALAVDDETAGLLFGVVTTGSRDNSVTLGLAYGWENGNLSDRPAALVAAEARTGRSMKFITENYILPGGDVLASAGVRFFGERLSADLGLMAPLTEDELIAFPLVNFTWSW